MKLIIFDVGNAACSVISSPNNYGLMVDCGSNTEKTNPVDSFKSNKKWLGITPYVTSQHRSYVLGLLHITHPDDDHVKNAKRIREELTPYLLKRCKHEEFPDGDSINDDYIEYIDNNYRGTNPELINWGFEVNDTFQIPMEVVKSNELLSQKVRNNSSILRYLKHDGVRILFTGDLEVDGWQYLVDNNESFTSTISEGIDILIAPHHGHISGFPRALFDKCGNVKVIIHSKGSEGNIEGTDVSSQYSDNSEGIEYKNLGDESFYRGKVLTTRSNGAIYIDVNLQSFGIFTEKASPNHEKIG